MKCFGITVDDSMPTSFQFTCFAAFQRPFLLCADFVPSLGGLEAGGGGGECQPGSLGTVGKPLPGMEQTASAAARRLGAEVSPIISYSLSAEKNTATEMKLFSHVLCSARS